MLHILYKYAMWVNTLKGQAMLHVFPHTNWKAHSTYLCMTTAKVSYVTELCLIQALSNMCYCLYSNNVVSELHSHNMFSEIFS